MELEEGAFGMRVFGGFAAAGLVLALACCGEPPLDDPVIVEIGDRVITRSQFEGYVASMVDDQAPFAEGALKAELLSQFIEEQLLLMAAEVKGIHVDPNEVEALALQVEKMADSRVPASSDDVEARRAKTRLDFESHLRVRKFIDEQVLKDLEVAETEIASYYEEHREFYRRPEAVDVSQILVDSEDEAAEILGELKKRPSRFEELAQERSMGPESDRKGHLGTFRKGELPPSFEKEVFALRKGRLSEVVKTDFGFHIFRVNEIRRSRDLKLEEVADAIRVQLLRQKSDETMALYIEELRRQYPVKVYGDRLDFPYT
jgi:peptidyl-prolyl cis-trans isomerase C